MNQTNQYIETPPLDQEELEEGAQNLEILFGNLFIGAVLIGGILLMQLVENLRNRKNDTTRNKK